MPAKSWIIWLESGAKLAIERITSGQETTGFRVVLLVDVNGKEHCVARYDTAHGIPHRDILGLQKGKLEKEWFFGSTKGEVFKHAIDDFKTNWQAHRDFYLAH